MFPRMIAFFSEGMNFVSGQEMDFLFIFQSIFIRPFLRFLDWAATCCCVFFFFVLVSSVLVPAVVTSGPVFGRVSPVFGVGGGGLNFSPTG